jgi:hypothetical protein
MKKTSPLPGFLLILLLATFSTAALTVSPNSRMIELEQGQQQTFSFSIGNDGNGTEENIFSTSGGIPSSWISLPPNLNEIYPSQEIPLYYTIDIPSNAGTGTYNAFIQLTSDTSAVQHEFDLTVTGASATTTTNPTTTTTLPTDWKDEWDEILDNEVIIEDDEYAIWGDDDEFKLKVTTVYSSSIKAKFYEDGDLKKTVTIQEDDWAEIDPDFRVELHRADNDDEEAKISIWSQDNDHKVTITDTSIEDFEYTLVSEGKYGIGTVIDFSEFIAKIEYTGWNGIYLSIQPSAYNLFGVQQQGGQQQYHSCLKGTYCTIYPGTMLMVEDTDSQSATITVKSKNNLLVRSYDPTAYYGGSAYPFQQQQTGTQPNPFYPMQQQQQAGTDEVDITLCGGQVAPGAKAIFCINKKSSNIFYQTSEKADGTFILNVPNAQSVDIRQGLAEMFIPPSLSCPVTATAIVDGEPHITLINCGPAGGSTDGTDTSTNWGWSTGYSCSDGVRNGDEEAVDCGGDDCDPCTKNLQVSLSTTNMLKGETVTITVRDEDNDLMDGVTIEIEKPNGGIITKTTSNGQSSYTTEETGVHDVLVQKSGYKDHQTSFQARAKQLRVDISPGGPYMVGDTISITVRDQDSGNQVSAEVWINGERAFGSYTFEKKGSYSVVARYSDYQEKSSSLEAKEVTRIVSPPILTKGEESKVKLNNDEQWEVTFNGEVIAYGTGKDITFIPEEAGAYSIVTGDTTLGTYSMSSFNYMYVIALLGMLSVLLVVAIIRKGKTAKEGPAKSKLGNKGVEDVLKKIKEDKVEVTTFNAGSS